jgi:hypothetical protein
MKIRLGLVLGMCLSNMSVAQGPVQPVEWSASSSPQAPVKRGISVTIEVTASVQEGWHVYGLVQVADGPTPLLATLYENATAEAAGAVSGTDPIKRQDPSFNLETQFYEKAFSLHIPARIKKQAAVGRQLIPVSVRFQSCNDSVCLPPRTVHLSVPVEVDADAGANGKP